MSSAHLGEWRTGHDGAVSETTPSEPLVGEVVFAPAGSDRPHPIDTLREVMANTMGLAGYTAVTLANLVQQTVTYSVTTTVNTVLDAAVPRITDAVISRIALTDLVLEQVDLRPIVMRALEEIDLTQIVLQQVDIDAIVAAADMEAIIDRVPIVPIANYVIDEIDLPQIIRQSTGGVATDAINAVRVQGVGADQYVATLVDHLLRRKTQRKVDAPGDPESLLTQVAAEAEHKPERAPVDEW